MVQDLHDWLYKNLSGVFLSGQISFFLPFMLYIFLFTNELPNDYHIFKLNLKQLSKILPPDFFPTNLLLPVLYSYLTWVLVDVTLAVFIGRDFFTKHKLGTTASLILSFIYTVEPSILAAAQ